MAKVTAREAQAAIRGDVPYGSMQYGNTQVAQMTTATTMEIPPGVAKCLEEARAIVDQLGLLREQLEQRVGFVLMPLMQNTADEYAEGPQPVVSLLETRLQMLNASMRTELRELGNLANRAQH